MSTRRIALLMATASVVACTGGGDGADVATAVPQGTSPGPPAATASAHMPGASELPTRQQILTVYRTYTRLVSDALARGDADVAGLEQVTTRRALREVRARIAANADAGVVTDGRLVPAATDADVHWGGGDAARVSDCVLNGLSHLSASGGDVVEEATGTRRPVAATLRRVDGRWVVARAEMVQDTDADNPQEDPPFLRGPMPDGPPSCAPPEIEQEVLAGYRAFWDAFDRAFGFGRDGPANPDDPALAATSVDPQLSDSKEFFNRMRDRNETSVGERDQRDPWITALADFDSVAFVSACARLANSSTINTETSEATSVNPSGRLDYEEVRMVEVDDRWLVSHWTTVAEGIAQCEPLR